MTAGLRGAVPIVLATIPLAEGVRDSARLFDIVFVMVSTYDDVKEVVAGDTVESLTTRVLAREYPLLIAVLQLAVAGRIAEREASVVFDGHALFTPLQLDSTGLTHPLA